MAVSATISFDKTVYEVGDPIVATVQVTGTDPGFQKTVTVETVVTVDGIQIPMSSGQFDVIDQPDVVVVESLVSSDPAITFAKDATNQFRWTATAV